MEIAGIVLAVFPLLGSTIEGVNLVKSVFSLQQEYWSCRQRVGVERVLFENNLRLLLQPIICDEQRVDELISHPNDVSWRETELNEKVRMRLDRSYGVYLDTVSSIARDLYSLTKSLGTSDEVIQARLGPTHSHAIATFRSSTDRASALVKYEIFCLKFLYNARNRERLLDSLTKQNRQIRTLLEQQDELASCSTTPHSLAPRKPLAKSPLVRCWRHASNIYSLMQKLWCCDCRDHHHAELLLRHHNSNTKEVDYRVYFNFANGVDDMPDAPWRFTAATIFPGDSTYGKASRAQPLSPLAVMSDIVQKEAAEASKNRRKRPGKRGVSFVLPAASVMASSPNTIEPTEPEITDLCATMANAFGERKCLGIASDDSKHYFIEPLAYQEPPNTKMEFIPLSEALRGEPKELSQRKRFSVALAIASSFLQLHNSPWLGPHWGKEDVYVVYDRHTGKFYDEPRISRNFSAITAPGTSQSDPSISTLGIILMELCYGVSIDKRPERERFRLAHIDKDTVDLFIALDLDKGYSLQYMDTGYASAVSYCLKNTIMKQSAGFDDREWREVFLKRVVEPLALCTEYALKVEGPREEHGIPGLSV
ncbi:MAG: hypothetical protein Q9191_001945 [Dirinaria sp. TL-2023a]